MKNENLDPLSMEELSKVHEGDATDPLTLTNMILDKDLRKQGFNHVHQQRDRAKSAQEIFAEAPEKVDQEGEFEKDKPIRIKELPVKEDIDVLSGNETNTNDKTLMSSDPKFNMCPAYLEGICRVDGRPCPYSNIDFKECGKVFLAQSGDPQLFEIPPGRETEDEYKAGIKS